MIVELAYSGRDEEGYVRPSVCCGGKRLRDEANRCNPTCLIFKMEIPVQVHLRILALALVVCGPFSASSFATVDLDTARKSVIEGEKAFEEKRFADSARAYAAAMDTGIHCPDIAYSAAEAYSKAGDPKSAFKYLSMAIDLGFHGDLSGDADLQPLHVQPLWTELVQRHERKEKAYRATHSNPNNVHISTSDVSNFWHAYDLAVSRPAAEWQEIFLQEYFDKRSPGLEDYFVTKIRSEADFVRTLQRLPKFYAGIRDESLALAENLPEIKKSFRRLKTLYPQAIFPDIYFFVGELTSGGTSTSTGLLLGSEMISVGPKTSVDELGPWERLAVAQSSSVPGVLAHEIIHFEQLPSGDNRLLAASLTEGAADFMGAMISGESLNDTQRTYGDSHEAELWQSFSQEMNGTNLSHWLYQGDKHPPGVPADLGYYVGRKICEAYYQRAKDKKKAIRELVEMRDATKILQGSGYAEQFSH
jgi:hypothetical protein